MTKSQDEDAGHGEIVVECARCGSIDYVDTAIHDGQSVRRDCAKCRNFMCWPVWNCETPGDSEPVGMPGIVATGSTIAGISQGLVDEINSEHAACVDSANT